MFCTYEKENTGKAGRVQQRSNCSVDKKKIRAQKELEENTERFQIFARVAAAWAHGRRVPTGSGRAGPPRCWRRRRAARARSGRGCGGARGEARSGRGGGGARRGRARRLIRPRMRIQGEGIPETTHEDPHGAAQTRGEGMRGRWWRSHSRVASATAEEAHFSPDAPGPSRA